MADIKPEDLVPGFAEQVCREPGAERLRSCYACGTCSAGCPVERVDGRYNPRRIIRMILLGMKRRLFEENFIWLCSSCYTCQERCPQGVRVTEVITAVRNLAAREGSSPSGVVMQSDLISSQGKLYALDEFDDKKRKKAGLPSLPFINEEVGKLLEDEK